MDSESLHVHIKTEPKKETTISIPLAITKSRIMIEITEITEIIQVTEIIDRQLLYIQTRLKKNVFQFSFVFTPPWNSPLHHSNSNKNYKYIDLKEKLSISRPSPRG